MASAFSSDGAAGTSADDIGPASNNPTRPTSRYGATSSPDDSFGSSWSDASSMASSAPNKRLSVTAKSKIEIKQQDILEAELKRSPVYSVLRWIVSVFLLLGVLVSLVCHKVSVITIMYHLGETTHDSGTVRRCTQGVFSTVGCATNVLMLVLILIIPHLLALLRSLWCGGFRNDRPWPSPTALFWGLVASLCEGCGVALFVTQAAPNLPPYISILIMNGIFFVPIVTEMRMVWRSGSARDRICFIMALTFGVAAIALMIVYAAITNSYHPLELWAIPSSGLLLSAAWCPWVTKAQLRPSKATLQRLLSNSGDFGDDTSEDETDGVSNGYRNFGGSNSSVDETQPLLTRGQTNRRQIDEDIIFRRPNLSARWKSTIITSVLKIIFTTGFCYLLCFVPTTDQVFTPTDFATGFTLFTVNHPDFIVFMLAITMSLCANLLTWGACTMCMQRIGFVIPLALATPLSVFVFVLQCIVGVHLPITVDGSCWENVQELAFMVAVAVCLYFSQFLSTLVFVAKTQTIVMQRESELFWLPGYHGVFLEQWLLLNRRKVQGSGQAHQHSLTMAKDSRVYICTTMFREAPHEMEQLLRSIGRVNYAKQEGNRHFEAHIFFDGGCRGQVLTEFALQLICVAKKTLDVKPQTVTKTLTPYGIRLSWKLASIGGREGMPFTIHLKDNMKVKNKKRWSQVMYMSYVLDYLLENDATAEEDNTFILTTDADVKFNPESVEALLDLAIRDKRVGAVCARTHPMGSGPLVWYQMFDYAIGHWLQKATEDVLGSVLCCPGCFSVYRAKAVREIIPTYATTVNKASEFLVKDMGEDRWLCTLMIENGWRLEYCAAAECSTYCPEDFDEFFKQRRRWTPSTLANQYLLMAEWNIIAWFNAMMPFHFRLYEAILLFSTLISPAVCLLIIVGGLKYSIGIDEVASTILLLLVIGAFTVVCLTTSQDTQLQVAKVLSITFILIMAAVCIGTAVQMVEDSQTKPHHNVTDKDGPQCPEPSFNLPVSVTVIYLAALVGVFLVTGVLHPTEFFCLIPGVLYLFTIPATTIILMVYSICNITDRSWGTREAKTTSSGDGTDVLQTVVKFVKKFFVCCKKEEAASAVVHAAMEPAPAPRRNSEDATEDSEPSVGGGLPQNYTFNEEGLESGPMTVRSWLPHAFNGYIDLFEREGYTDTTFLVGVGDKDLKALGIENKSHRAALVDAIRRLPDFDIDPSVPSSVVDWLRDIGLLHYDKRFRRCMIINPSDLQRVKVMSDEDFRKELGVKKQAHLRRLRLAVRKLQYPSEDDIDRQDMSVQLAVVHLCKLEETNKDEWEFWEQLRRQCLKPDMAAFVHNEASLKEQLTDLRNKTLVAYGVANAIWLILIMTLVSKCQLNILGTNPLGLSFLLIFGIIVIIQFLCMIVHRVRTLVHLVARAPCKCGDPIKASWSFTADGEDSEVDQRRSADYQDAVRQVQEARKLEDVRFRRKVSERKNRKRVAPSPTSRRTIETISEEPSPEHSIIL